MPDSGGTFPILAWVLKGEDWLLFRSAQAPGVFIIQQQEEAQSVFIFYAQKMVFAW